MTGQMAGHERRDLFAGVEIEERDGEPIKIRGLAARYYDPEIEGTEYALWDGAVERIMPGAFRRAIEGGDDVRALFNHDPNYVLGRTTAGTLRLTDGEAGLGYDISPGNTQPTRDLLEMLRRGDVTGSSFAFESLDDQWRVEDGVAVREIRSVRLYDVSPVTYPAYEATSVGLRASRPGEAMRSYERWLAREHEARQAQAEAERRTLEARIRLAELG